MRRRRGRWDFFFLLCARVPCCLQRRVEEVNCCTSSSTKSEIGTWKKKKKNEVYVTPMHKTRRSYDDEAILRSSIYPIFFFSTYLQHYCTTGVAGRSVPAFHLNTLKLVFLQMLIIQIYLTFLRDKYYLPTYTRGFHVLLKRKKGCSPQASTIGSRHLMDYRNGIRTT